MKKYNYEIIKYNSSYYEEFKKLSLSFPEFQPTNHIYHTKEMFENLYKGFGHTSSSSLLIINKQNQVKKRKILCGVLRHFSTNKNRRF